MADDPETAEMAVESPTRTEPREIVLGGDLLAALHDEGIIPPDLYTVAGSTSIRVERGQVVSLHVEIVLPLDRLQRVLERVRARVEGA